MTRPAGNPGRTGRPGHYLPLVRAVVHGLRHRVGVSTGAHVVVACSGGADSVAMLRALHLLHRRRNWDLSLTVAHVQHHLRPADDAEADARFVADLSASLDLPHARRDVSPGNDEGNVEANARDARYAALTDIAHEAGAAYVATAHHADDHLETLLMALLRGTTARGLRGIAEARPLSDGVTLIRPMLDAIHAQAIAFLDHLDQPWREDRTNIDRSRTRARLRHDVLPVLRELRPSVARKALELSDALRELDLDRNHGPSLTHAATAPAAHRPTSSPGRSGPASPAQTGGPSPQPDR